MNNSKIRYLNDCQNPDSRDTLACAGRLFLERSYLFLKNSKYLMRSSQGAWLPEYRYFMIMGQLMKLPKPDSKLLLRFLIENGYVKFSGQKKILIRGVGNGL